MMFLILPDNQTKTPFCLYVDWFFSRVSECIILGTCFINACWWHSCLSSKS